MKNFLVQLCHSLPTRQQNSTPWVAAPTRPTTSPEFLMLYGSWPDACSQDFPLWAHKISRAAARGRKLTFLGGKMMAIGAIFCTGGREGGPCVGRRPGDAN